MTDHQAIETLIYTYAAHLDRGDFAAVGQLFAHATFGGRGRPRREGAAAVQATFDHTVRRHADGTPRTLHVTTNVRITVDGDTARAESYFTVYQQTATLPLQVIIAGRYSDTFACEDGRWRFSARVVDTDLTGPLHEHLLNAVMQ